MQAVHAETEQLDNLITPNPVEPNIIPEGLRLPVQTEPDQVVTFAWHDRVSFNYSRHYISPDEMLKKLQQERKKNFLLIRLEKQFEWDDEENRKLGKKRVIEFAKKTGYRRCLITIDSAFHNIVLADLDGRSESKEQKRKPESDKNTEERSRKFDSAESALSDDTHALDDSSPSAEALNVTGTWEIEVQLENQPRFSGKHQIELYRSRGEISGSFHPEENCSYGLTGQVINPNRLEFTLPLVKTYIKGETFPKEVDHLWITFVGDLTKDRNDRLSLVGSYTRFDREHNKLGQYSPTGPVKQSTGSWRANKVSTEAKFVDSAKCMLFQKHLEGTRFRDDPASPTGFYIPNDLEDALHELDRTLPPAAKEDVRQMSESETWMLFQIFGSVIRSNWGLCERSRLAQCLDSKDPYGDGMSSYILEKYWSRLHSKIQLR